MKNRFQHRVWFLGATHLVAFAAGWGIWTAAGDSEIVREAVGEARKSFRASDRSGGQSESRSASRILDDASKDDSFRVDPKMKRVDQYRLRLVSAEKLLELAKSTAPADDVGVVAIEKLKACLAAGKVQEGDQESQVRLLHWMQQDPDAAFAWFASQSRDELVVVASLLRGSMDALISEQGVEAAVGWMGKNSRIDGEVRRMIADHAGANADLGQLEEIKSGLEKQQWNEVRLSMIDTWPMEKADDLMRLVEAENAPLTILLFAKNQGPKGVEWLHRQFTNEEIDPAFRAALQKHQDYHKMMFKAPQMDFEKRVEVVQSFEPGKPVEQIKYELGVYDVVDTLNSGRDWRYAFRNGTATAEQIYQEMAKQLPELASKSPESLKLQLFKELSEFGGPDAIKLLDGFPEEKKWEMAMKAPQWNFLEANPDDFHQFVSAIPADAGGKAWDVRMRAWQDKSNRYESRLGSGYVDWVKSLPEGIDREMASYAVLKRKGNSDPELAETLRGQIKDSRIQELLNAE